jgi:hypothetical protein
MEKSPSNSFRSNRSPEYAEFQSPKNKNLNKNLEKDT